MPFKEEMINNGQYEYNLPNQNLGLIEPTIHISGEKFGMIVMITMDYVQILLEYKLKMVMQLLKQLL